MSKNKFIKTSLLNIDSAYRNITPKNIVKSDGKILPNNPMTFTKGSTTVSINYPSHSLKTGDYITIQNVIGRSKTLVDSFILINNFKYLIIVLFDQNINPMLSTLTQSDTQAYYNFGLNTGQINEIPSDYKSYTDDLYINIELVGNQTESNLINNINLNNLLGIKKCLLASDIPANNIEIIKKSIKTLFGNDDLNIINRFTLFVELPIPYINDISDYYTLKQIFKVSYMHIGGIKLGYLNTNYPINNYNYQSNYEIKNVLDENNFEIILNYPSYGNLTGGGKNIQIMKILNSIGGYPDADFYTINLKNSFNNVTGIELSSSEIPYIDLTIKKDVNDKLYWYNIEDGQNLYKLQIDDGYYSSTTLLEKIKNKINQIPRINSTQTNPNYNYFEIVVESNIQKITFKPYNLKKLPNSLSIRSQVIDSQTYYILNVGHPNNLVEIDDQIEISNSSTVTLKKETNEGNLIYEVSANYINGIHKIYGINLENQTYDILLGKESEIANTLVTIEKAGGVNILVKSKTKISFLFNKTDTFGDIIGFKNVGDAFSVTEYSSEVSNKDSYVYSNNLNSVGNEIDYSSGFFNLSGKFNYILMYLNDIEFVYSNNNIPGAFAKISLAGSPGDILFDTFVTQPQHIYSKAFPISTLTEIKVRFLYPDGSRVNFRNINHSFTLKITEEQERNDNTNLNSQTISVSDEFKRANLND
jgi:hypothetical protein